MKANNSKPTRIASIDTSSASDSDTTPTFVDSYLNSNLPHKTSITADHGHDYQKELFLHFCLIFNNWEDCLWKIGFEVKDSVKFDDIVAEFEINGQKYNFLIQAKHAANMDKIVTRDHILSQAVKKGNMEKNFEVKQYYDAAIKDTRSSDRIWKFCVLTNYKIDLGDPSSDFQTTEETDPIFKKLFEKLNNSYDKDIQIIKFEKEITLNDGFKITNPFFLNNFTYVSQLPNFQDLTTINNAILVEKYVNFKSKNFSKVRNNVFNSLRVTKDAQGNLTRNPMTKDEFIKIIQNSVLELDFPAFSVDFCNQFNWLDFTEEALKAVDQNQKEHFCHGNAKLLSFMIYKALTANFNDKSDQKKIFCIPFSKLTQIYRESLRVFEHKVVVYVEQKDPKEDYAAYKNAIFVFQSSAQHPESKICTFESLTDKSKDHFLSQKIKLQGYLVEIAKITDDSALLTEILQEMFNEKQPLELGTELHSQELPKYYMDRLFTNNTTKEENIKEEDIYEEGQNIIIQGLAGVGKSTAMLKVAKIIKKNNPQLFVQLIDLKTHSDILKKIKEKGVRITDDHQDNTIDLWMFVKANFLGINPNKEKSQTVEELLLEHYIKEATPKIVLFLDGFDEISPLYSEQIIQIIEGLKVKKIQMFLSSQSHLKETINKLGFHKQYTLEPYNRVMQREFLRQYWGNKLQTMIKENKIAESDVEKQNIHAYTKKFFKMCYRSKLTDITPSIPLMLNILADTYLAECMEFCKKTSKNWSENILEVDVLMIYEKIFKDNCKKFYRKTEEKASNVFVIMKEQDNIEEVRRTHMEIAAKHLLRRFWMEEGGLDVEKMKHEIYGRGFITGNKDGEYIFIYKTFMSFFAADWFTRKIFPDNKLLDINLLKCLLKKEDDKKKDKTLEDTDIDRDVTSFIYRFMLKKLKEVKEKLNLEQHKGEANQVSDFILSFFHYAWFNREISQLEIVFDMAKTFCPNEKVKEICKNKKLLEALPFTSPGQLKLTVDIYDYYFGPEVTNAIMKNRNMDKILNQIIKEANFQLFKDYFDLLTKRNIVTDQKNLTKRTYENFRNYLKKQKVSSWMFAREMLLWHYEHLNTSQDEILSLMEEIIGEEKFKERHFLGHSLASFWDWKENDKAFLETICNQTEFKKNYYRFLYALNSVTREDILEKAIEVMRENGCRFTCHDGKSVLCHAFEDNNNYLVERLLKILTKTEVEAQIKDEVCGGNSIIRQCTTENLLCVIFIRYILDNFGKEHKDIIQEFFSPMDEGKELPALESNIKFLNTMIKKDIKLEKGKIQDCMKNLWSEALSKDVNLLHVIAKEGKFVDIVEHVFNYLKACPDNVLLRHLERVDEKGNTPSHLAVQGTTTIFLDEIENNIPKEDISILFSIKNCEGKDVFDIIYENKKFPGSGEEYFTTYGVASFSKNEDN